MKLSFEYELENCETEVELFDLISNSIKSNFWSTAKFFCCLSFLMKTDRESYLSLNDFPFVINFTEEDCIKRCCYLIDHLENDEYKRMFLYYYNLAFFQGELEDFIVYLLKNDFIYKECL